MISRKPSARDVVKLIGDQAQDVRRAATALSERIKKFEKWLAELPGKVAASHGEPHDEDGRETFNVSFDRSGKEWALSFFYFDEEHQRFFGESGLLRDASVEIKMRAIRMFPKLLDAIYESQKSVVKLADERSAEFDAFVKDLDIKEGQ